MRRVIVGFSGGVTSAWCAGWALEHYPAKEVVFLFHDTQEEDDDTYRFIADGSAALNHPITERSDGRSVTELCYDENALPNQRMAFCSRTLKAEQGERYIKELQSHGVSEVVKILGFSANEPDRCQRAAAWGMKLGYEVRFPVVEEKATKQECADWCTCVLGVALPRMYEWSDHANCVGCVRGGKAYWLKVAERRPDIFEQRARLEDEFKHTFLNGISLRELKVTGLKRAVNHKESIEIGPCECGD